MRILICGTNYGASYIRALALQPANASLRLTLSGILSNGSERSKAYAKAANAQHYCQVSEIADGTIDIACVAIAGQAAEQIVLDLLDKRIHVICEHPVTADFVQKAQTKAQQHNLVFFVNAHFGDLPAPKAFVDSFQIAKQQGQCIHSDLAVNLRTLYSGLDLIGRAMGTVNGLQVSLLKPQNSQPTDPAYFANLLLHAQGVNISLICQNFSSTHDDGSATFINHRFNTTFTHGSLHLNESFGPVIWIPSLNTINSGQWQNYQPIEPAQANAQQMMQQRDIANLNLIYKLISTTQGHGIPNEQQPHYLLALAKLWDEVMALLQPAE